jgi:hypothetical protein
MSGVEIRQKMTPHLSDVGQNEILLQEIREKFGRRVTAH